MGWVLNIMTVEEFKKLKPEYANTEGDQLWNAMEDYALTIQSGEEILRPTLPFWKTHTIRWLFYRKSKNWSYAKYSETRCKHCKNGKGSQMMWSMTNSDGTRSMFHGCGKPYEIEPNTNLDYRIYKIRMILYKWTIELFWIAMDKLHIVRISGNDRYGIFGDERRHVKSWNMSLNKPGMTPIFVKRKWWEYIFIEKPRLNV